MLLGRPVSDHPDPCKWHLHRLIVSFVRLVRRQGLTLELVRLPRHRDRRHPTGYLVVSCPQRPGFRADLGRERTSSTGAGGATDQLFMEITAVIPNRRTRSVHEICEVREPRASDLLFFVDEVRRCLMASAHPSIDDWWFSGKLC